MVKFKNKILVMALTFVMALGVFAGLSFNKNSMQVYASGGEISTIADVVSTVTFPTIVTAPAPKCAWTNENGVKLYVFSDRFAFDGTSVSLTSSSIKTDVEVTPIGDNFTCTNIYGARTLVVIFNMENNKLVSVVCSDSDDKISGTYIPNHTLTEVPGQSATCTTDGYEIAYKCSECELYFEDCLGVNEIGDATAYNTWKQNAGKILARHTENRVAGVDPTPNRSGYKEAWKCSECNKYFEDKDCTILIGDEEAYNTWKTTDGYLEKLPNNGLSTGAIVGIVCGSTVSLGAIGYLIWFIIKKKKEDNK